MVDYKETLTRAVELMQCGWTQGAFARDDQLKSINFDSPDAICFCASGAIARALIELTGFTNGTGDVMRYVESVSLSDESIVYFNDNHTFEEVKEVFERAICQLD